MWKYLIVLCPLIVTVAHAGSATCFKYNNQSGRCEKAGKQGFNKADPGELFKKFDKKENSYAGVDAECVDFRGFDFEKHIGFRSTHLEGWNLKGANLAGVKLHFAHILNADFSGTNFKDMDWGYVQLTGKIDKHTILPEDCKDKTKNGKVDCMK